MTKALVLLSGGLDSTTCAALAVFNYGKENVIGLGFNYGQIHPKELEAAKAVSKYLGIQYITQDLQPQIFQGAGSSLMGESEVPTGPYPDTLGPLNTYVPFRNGTLLSIATAFSQRYEVDYIYCGAHAEDAKNWAYPDCTPEFLDAMKDAIYIGTYRKTTLVTPLERMMKTDIVKLALRIGAPIHLSWSCYRGLDKPCKTCPTCISRQEAFKANGLMEDDWINERRKI